MCSAHEGNRSQCEICDLKTKVKGNLRNHKQTVCEGTSLKCNKCDRETSTKGKINT